MLSGEQSAGEWIVNTDPHPLIDTEGQHFVLDAPGNQVVRRLYAVISR